MPSRIIELSNRASDLVSPPPASASSLASSPARAGMSNNSDDDVVDDIIHNDFTSSPSLSTDDAVDGESEGDVVMEGDNLLHPSPSSSSLFQCETSAQM